MALSEYGVQQKNRNERFPDELYLRLQSRKFKRLAAAFNRSVGGGSWKPRQIPSVLGALGLEYLGSGYGFKVMTVGTSTALRVLRKQSARGNPVIFFTQATSHGHVVKGNKPEGGGANVNDPYGDKTRGYPNNFGENAVYNRSAMHNDVKVISLLYFYKK
jgi:hypothetical protein